MRSILEDYFFFFFWVFGLRRRRADTASLSLFSPSIGIIHALYIILKY